MNYGYEFKIHCSIHEGDYHPEDDEIGKYCDQREAFAYCKQYTDAGFRTIDAIALESMYDPELMVKKMFGFVDSIYDDKGSCRERLSVR